jgi:PAS domain S-box-containing protein
VVRAWAEYQDAALPHDSEEFMLVADDDSTYVAATQGVSRVLGYDPAELVGRRIEDVAAPEFRAATPGQWNQFLLDGRQGGSYRLRAKDGELVALRFQARAHHPVPGFHVSRLWPEDAPAESAGQRPTSAIEG